MQMKQKALKMTETTCIVVSLIEKVNQSENTEKQVVRVLAR